jgi:ribonuclease HI
MIPLNNLPIIEIYTDGSCHTQKCVGGWAAIILIDTEKVILSGKETDTTHNRMELLAVIKSVDYIRKNYPGISEIKLISDSQYVIGLTSRKEKFTANNYSTKKGNDIKNMDLVKELLNHTEIINIKFTKIKAHQKKDETINYNIEADKLSRKIVREMVKKNYYTHVI